MSIQSTTFGEAMSSRRGSYQTGKSPDFTDAGPSAPSSHRGSNARRSSITEQITQYISVPADIAVYIVGRGGSKISEICESSGARMSIAEAPHDDTGERTLAIMGGRAAVEKALDLLYEIFEEDKMGRRHTSPTEWTDDDEFPEQIVIEDFQDETQPDAFQTFSQYWKSAIAAGSTRSRRAPSPDHSQYTTMTEWDEGNPDVAVESKSDVAPWAQKVSEESLRVHAEYIKSLITDARYVETLSTEEFETLKERVDRDAKRRQSLITAGEYAISKEASEAHSTSNEDRTNVAERDQIPGVDGIPSVTAALQSISEQADCLTIEEGLTQCEFFLKQISTAATDPHSSGSVRAIASQWDGELKRFKLCRIDIEEALSDNSKNEEEDITSSQSQVILEYLRDLMSNLREVLDVTNGERLPYEAEINSEPDDTDSLDSDEEDEPTELAERLRVTRAIIGDLFRETKMYTQAAQLSVAAAQLEGETTATDTLLQPIHQSESILVTQASSEAPAHPLQEPERTGSLQASSQAPTLGSRTHRQSVKNQTRQEEERVSPGQTTSRSTLQPESYPISQAGPHSRVAATRFSTSSTPQIHHPIAPSSQSARWADYTKVDKQKQPQPVIVRERPPGAAQWPRQTGPGQANIRSSYAISEATSDHPSGDRSSVRGSSQAADQSGRVRPQSQRYYSESSRDPRPERVYWTQPARNTPATYPIPITPQRSIEVPSRQYVEAQSAPVSDDTRSRLIDDWFRVRPDAASFFTVGRVFDVLWIEPATGPVRVAPSAATRGKASVELVDPSVRNFIVIREHGTYCSALPIRTYDGQGLAKRGIRKEEHGIIYIGRVPPKLTRLEQAADGHSSIQSEAIRINPDHPSVRLDPMSRLCYSQVHTIQHNIRARSNGKVHPGSKTALLSQFASVWQSGLTEHAAASDDHAPISVIGRPLGDPQNKRGLESLARDLSALCSRLESLNARLPGENARISSHLQHLGTIAGPSSSTSAAPPAQVASRTTSPEQGLPEFLRLFERARDWTSEAPADPPPVSRRRRAKNSRKRSGGAEAVLRHPQRSLAGDAGESSGPANDSPRQRR